MTARILVVDDILPNIKLLEAKLSAEYFDVLSASDGESALEIATSEMPDLILLDVMMPGLDGFQVCERLRANPKTRHIPIVMVTALSDVSDRVRGLEAGADDFLSKPVNDVALFARVRSLVRLKMMIDELRLRQATSGEDEIFDEDTLGGDSETENARILVIEANEFLGDKLTQYLTGAGHKVDLASRPDEGLALGGQNAYDLIMVNLVVDGEDGLRLCSQFRSQEQTRHVPILLVLDDVDLPKLAKGLDLGVNDYLVKPIDENELLARTRTQIRRRRYHDKLREMLESSVSMAYTDGLTGVYNRRYMNSHLDRKIMEIADSAKSVSVMMFDIDHFKQVNDSYGHASGDEVLKDIAVRVSDNVRDFDLVSRYGGEEFVIIMPNTAAEAAYMVAERVRNRIADTPFAIPGREQPLPVTISVGVATTSDPAEQATTLLGRVDVLLYEAKGAGRNCTRSDEIAAAPEAGQAALAGG